MTKKNFAVFGLGRFGRNVALTLEQMGYNVLGVDKDENVAAEMASSLTKVVSFDIRDTHALKEVGISNFDTVVIASKSLEASLMATMLCKEMNVAEIIVKAIDERHAEMAKRLGATRVIFSERDTARRVARSLVTNYATDFTDIDENITIMSLNVPVKLRGKNLIESNLRGKYGLNIIAITGNGKTLVPPPPQHVLSDGEKIFILGMPDSLNKFEQDFL
ncbi:MAG: TrkA family potassium uptake protein [Selenomonadaceae bacterium]|nr:TrkA family potassium uptake protein [Selenomonadaceae bacterium]